MSQENFLETLAAACRFPQYRETLATHDKVVEILIQQIKSMSHRVSLFALKILRMLSQDFKSLETL